MGIKSNITGLSYTSSTTVASVKITVNIAAKAGMRAYVVAVGYSTDLAGSVQLQGGAAGTTVKFHWPTTTAAQAPIMFPEPLPLSDTNAGCNVVLDVTTTGRLSVAYFYAP